MKTLALLLAATAVLAACSERPQSVGDYRGKTDAKPYEANFGGDKAKWEAALRARNQNQNEYKRAE
ncbi:MAG: hypothetical protein JNJ60_09975 [Rhodocyclaceae bacterium]|nr:hypothetical protein [Rhodocyclaceae bacterium]